MRHLPGAVEIGRLARAQRNRIERAVHAFEQLAQLVAIDVGLAQQRLPQRGELDDQHELDLRRARAVQPILVDLPVEQHVHPHTSRDGISCSRSASQSATPSSAIAAISASTGSSAKRRAQLQRLDLRAQRARDDLRRPRDWRLRPEY